MRIETTRSTGSVRLEHTAGFHSSREQLLAQLLPLATAARDRGEPIAVALQPATEQALVERLGDDDLVRLDQSVTPDVASGQTVAARRALELRALTSSTGSPVTVLAEHSPALDGVDGGFWRELEAAVNVALTDLPIRATCFYPELPLHLEILDAARSNHPLLWDGAALRRNPDHRAPREVLAERPTPAPVLLGPPDLRLEFSVWQLHEVRTAIEQTLRDADYEPERAEDIVLAVNEVATNAVEHGTPEAQLSVWAGPGGLLCEVDDGGRLGDPLPGLQAPHPSEPHGRGVWIARQVCDSLHVWADARGTHVRMHANP